MAVIAANDQNFDQILSENPKVVVKFYADWCGSCKLFTPKFKRISSDEQFSDVCFVEVNAEENEITRKRAKVDNLPFMATFKNGEFFEGNATSLENVVVDMIKKL